MIIPIAAAGGANTAESFPELQLAATANVLASGATTGSLPGSPFVAGQFLVILCTNTGPANSTISSPAGATIVYNDDNGTRAANIFTVASLASATDTITLSAGRTRTRVLGYENANTGIVDWDVTYGVTPLAPGALDVTGKPRAKVYSIAGPAGNAVSMTFTAPANLTDDGGANGSNGWRRAELTTPVGAVSTFTISNWTSLDNTQSTVAVSIAVE